jgi:hypothetical protein
MLPIAIARELFGLQEGPSMEPVADRFSKWLVLRERWPEVALVGQHDSSAITSLENCAREVQDSPWLAELDKLHLADIADMHGLRRLLQIDPRFGDISDLAFVSIVPSEAVNAGVTASA